MKQGNNGFFVDGWSNVKVLSLCMDVAKFFALPHTTSWVSMKFSMGEEYQAKLWSLAILYRLSSTGFTALVFVFKKRLRETFFSKRKQHSVNTACVASRSKSDCFRVKGYACVQIMFESRELFDTSCSIPSNINHLMKQVNTDYNRQTNGQTVVEKVIPMCKLA